MGWFLEWFEGFNCRRPHASLGGLQARLFLLRSRKSGSPIQKRQFDGAVCACAATSATLVGLRSSLAVRTR